MASDDQSYYPSAKLALVIRFDNFADPSVDNAGRAANVYSPLKMNGTSQASPSLTLGNDPNAPAGITRTLLQGQGAVTGKPQDQASSADGYTVSLAGVIPKSASLGLNGARTADTLSATLKWIDLPVDPRVVRSCAVYFYLGTVTADQFADGINGQTRNASNGGAEPLNVVPDDWVDEYGQQRTNVRFMGWVDTWKVEWPADEEPTVKLECRDNTALLIEADAPFKLVISMSKPLDQAIAAYLANFQQFAGMTVEYRPAGFAPPVLNTVLSKTAYRPNLGPQPAKGGGAGSKLAVWDYITDVCGSVGHICRVEDANLIIQRSVSYTDGSYGRPDDPFLPRRMPNGDTFYVRRCIFGRDVESMTMAHNMAGKKSELNIEIRSYVPERKNVLVAHFPPQGANNRLEKAKPGDQPPDEKWTVYHVSGIKDQQTLDVIAQNYYQQHVRQELAVTIKTKNLASFGGDNTDPDLLDMKAGDPFEVLVNRSDEGSDVDVSTMTNVETVMLMQQRGYAFLTQLGFGDTFASAYAKAYTNANFTTVYCVKSITVTWNVDDGVAFDIVAVNYVAVRADLPLASGNLPPGTKKT